MESLLRVRAEGIYVFSGEIAVSWIMIGNEERKPEAGERRGG